MTNRGVPRRRPWLARQIRSGSRTPRDLVRRHAIRVTIIVALGIFTAELVVALTAQMGGGVRGWIAGDYEIYMEATRRWLDGGPFYHPYQMQGPYLVAATEVLYPPQALLLFVPFVGLPAITWWAVPILAIAGAVWAARPTAVEWALLAVAVALPRTVSVLGNGNPTLWVWAGIALAPRFGWPAVAALLKPTLMPFALLGVTDRRFWAAVAVLAAATVSLTTMVGEYVTVLRNARGPTVSAFYSLADVPLGLVLAGIVGGYWKGLFHAAPRNSAILRHLGARDARS